MDKSRIFYVLEYSLAVTFLVMGLTNTSPSFSDHSVTYLGPDAIDEGYAFIISCVMNVKDLAQWTIDGVEIKEDNDRGYVISEKLFGPFQKVMTLEVAGAQLHHEGEYRCNGYSREFHALEVVEADDVEEIEDDDDDDDDDDEDDDKDDDDDLSVVTQPSGDHILDINKTITIHCSTLTEDDTTPVYWYKNQRRIIPQEGSNIKLNRTHLTIENAQVGDAAEYMCTVDFLINTGIKEIGRTFRLKSAAKIKDFPSPRISVMLGKNFTLFCNVQGFPRPKITWYKDNLLMTNIMKEDSTRIWLYSASAQQNAHLTVRAVNFNDRGLYTCKAENSLDSVNMVGEEKSIFINVRENIIETNEDEPGLKLLTIGKDFVLQCNTTECPQCGIVWYKNGKRLDDDEDEDDEDDRIEIHEETHFLTIHDATYNDSGLYVCAINRDHLDIALNASVEVQSEIKLEKFDSPSDVVVEGHPLELHCRAKGSPKPLIKWFKGEMEINDTHERIKLVEFEGLKNGKLIIEEADFGDRDNYTCEAYNRVHSFKAAVFIRIKDRLAALWPFLGICVEVGILCTIIFVYEKRKNAECTEADTDFPTDNRNIPDPNQRAQQVRQRK